MSKQLIVVADATPLIALAKIDHLSLLPHFFGQVLIPQAVYTEIVDKGEGRLGAADIQNASWIQTEEITDRAKVSYLLTQLDIGEAEAIILAQEKQADWLLVDENKARSIAQRLDLPLIGTVGLLLLAKQQGQIAMLRPELDALLAHQFQLSQKVYESVLKQAKEW